MPPFSGGPVTDLSAESTWRRPCALQASDWHTSGHLPPLRPPLMTLARASSPEGWGRPLAWPLRGKGLGRIPSGFRLDLVRRGWV